MPKKIHIIAASPLLSLALSFGVFASSAKAEEIPNPIGTQSFAELIAKLSFWFYVFSIPILSLLILYGGFLILISAGEEEKYSKGIRVIKWGVIGFILIALSGAIAAIIRSVVS